jgi:urease accessory protein
MSAGRLALLQLCDSLFPVGSFAHSDGLEAAVADGWVRSTSELESWLLVQLRGSLVSADAAGVRAAIGAFTRDDIITLSALDDEIWAMRPSAAGRDALRAQGTRLLRTWQLIHPSDRLARIVVPSARYTHPVAFGCVCAAAGLAITESVEAFLYTRLAASVSAAMRLLPLGQQHAHALLARMLREVPGHAARVATSDDRPHAFAPRSDLSTMRHRYVHSRLFRS